MCSLLFPSPSLNILTKVLKKGPSGMALFTPLNFCVLCLLSSAKKQCWGTWVSQASSNVDILFSFLGSWLFLHNSVKQLVLASPNIMLRRILCQQESIVLLINVCYVQRDADLQQVFLTSWLDCSVCRKEGEESLYVCIVCSSSQKPEQRIQKPNGHSCWSMQIDWG